MRFFENGPNIPDVLLERRDQGQVVFLCGAGVSLPSGLPTFAKLTEYVVDFFDPPKGSELHTAFMPWRDEKFEGLRMPLDQIFQLLHQEYGRDQVNALVAERLAQVNNVGSDEHKHELIKKLSTDPEGNVQIVTTNFDRLFELNEAELPIYEPPGFPDVEFGVSLRGITYLHGRLNSPEDTYHPYVLSSADFGRAYLAEGWATNFILKLLKHYTVVLVGYQAEDPQVKYLLQGLNHDGKFDRDKIFAFDRGRHEDIETKWRDRGISAIAYNDHDDLWSSISAWSERARSPRAWRAAIIELAQRSPRELLAHERGQVAHVIKSTAGAKAFADSDASPEWLCVFDAAFRTMAVKTDFMDDEIFDPYQVYRLDDDPPRQEDTFRRQLTHEHLLSWRPNDGVNSSGHGICNSSIFVQPRLWHLLRWIIKNINNPITAWWALRQGILHPVLRQEIMRELWRVKALHPKAITVWNILLDYAEHKHYLNKENASYIFHDRVKNEGWHPGTLRFLRLHLAPYVEIRSPSGIEAVRPPVGDWESIPFSDLATWETHFPLLDQQDIAVPDENLMQVMEVLQSHIHSAVELCAELGIHYFYRVPTCYSNRAPNRIDDIHTSFEFYLRLFTKLAEVDPHKAKGLSASWAMDDSLYFYKLRLFSLNQASVYEGEEVLDFVLNMAQEDFWGGEGQRELLYLLRDRWKDFSDEGQRQLADRILNGPDKPDYQTDEEYSVKEKRDSYRLAWWLELSGVKLPATAKDKLESLRFEFPELDASWARSMADLNEFTTYRVASDESTQAIANKPASEVIEFAESVSEREFGSRVQLRPFTGLAKENPRKALASLLFNARNDKYPVQYWSVLLDEWCVDVGQVRLWRTLLLRLERLPAEAICSFSYSIGRWMEKHLTTAFSIDSELTWRIFDTIVLSLASDSGDATKSGLGDVYHGGHAIVRSRRTYSHAINSPVGSMAVALLNVLNTSDLQVVDGIPDELKTRLENLVKLPGEGGDHAMVILTRHLGYLDALDSLWVKEFLLGRFEFDSSCCEPAWNGLLSSGELPDGNLGYSLKPKFLGLFPRIYQWHLDEGLRRVACQMIVEFTLLPGLTPLRFSPAETRGCLRAMRDEERQSVIFYLSLLGQRDNARWQSVVIPFIKNVWPRESKFRTSNLISAWVSLLAESGDAFPDLLKEMKWLIVPAQIERDWLDDFQRARYGKRSLSTRFPKEVMALCNVLIQTTNAVPYSLRNVLEQVQAAAPELANHHEFGRLVDLLDSL
ncbi:SIR2 family protein [Shewanella cyperi]|uniref:SIR2 family protein n=1 Tax=Shewanella cyperi TaxID=2814292 RepID=A0A974XK08_9GAMM|nr:SIR2 family protein [Shewanella cyperi]QSX29842.1 SIR2 family protein [Shewanella cyperi]